MNDEFRDQVKEFIYCFFSLLFHLFTGRCRVVLLVRVRRFDLRFAVTDLRRPACVE